MFSDRSNKIMKEIEDLEVTNRALEKDGSKRASGLRMKNRERIAKLRRELD